MTRRTATQRNRKRRASRAFWKAVSEFALLSAITVVSVPSAAGFGWLLAQGMLRTY